MLAGVPPEQFDVELHRRVRDHLVAQGPADAELVGALAELDARAAQEAIDEVGANRRSSASASVGSSGAGRGAEDSRAPLSSSSSAPGSARRSASLG
jgi:hypothetical protein